MEKQALKREDLLTHQKSQYKGLILMIFGFQLHDVLSKSYLSIIL